MKKKLLAITLLIVFSGVGLLLAANQWYFWYWVSNTLSRATLNSSSAAVATSVSKIEEWWTCKTVTSTDARLLFVPTKTTTERSIFITKKPNHITLGTCGCTTNTECGAWNICSWYVAGGWYCDGEYEYMIPWHCISACHSSNCEPNCGALTTEYACWLPVQYTNYWFDEAPSCSRVNEQPWWTAYCGQEFQTQSECNSAPSPCTWINWTSTPGTCISQTCWSANNQTYSTLTSTSPNLCNAGSATSFVSNTSTWTRNCGTASCSANKQQVNICGNWILDSWEACDLSAPDWDICTWTQTLQKECNASCYCETVCQAERHSNGWRLYCSM